MADPRRPSLLRGPVVPTTVAKREDAKTNADLQVLLRQARMYSVSFGGQRSIQLSYGRLSASIDESGASSNGPAFARLEVGGASYGKVRAFESSRAHQLSCAEGVAGGTTKLSIKMPFGNGRFWAVSSAVGQCAGGSLAQRQ